MLCKKEKELFESMKIFYQMHKSYEIFRLCAFSFRQGYKTVLNLHQKIC